MVEMQMTVKEAARASLIVGTIGGATGYFLTKYVTNLTPQIGLINGVLAGATYPFVNYALQKQNSLARITSLVALEAINSVASYYICNALRMYISFKATAAVSCGLLLTCGIIFGMITLTAALATAKAK